MSDLLIEIGAEEIPAGYIVPALTAFRESLLSSMVKARINHGAARIYGTPRRLAVIVDNVADTQSAKTSTVMGPPARVGYDKDGKPTIAAEKFAEKAGVALSEVTVTQTDKGEYLTAVKEEACLPAVDILADVLPDLILHIPFPKRMRWGSLSISFARPIISLTALLGETVIPFTVGNITSSNEVFGHFFLHPGKVTVPSPKDYREVLRSRGVIVDIEERKALLVKEIEKVAKTHDCCILEDAELVDIVTNLVEYPYPVLGRFDGDFLEVPDEALITAMREHQKYFALTDEKGALKSCFIAVNNTMATDMDVVAAGHGKVIRARLADAKFFYKVDCESTLDEFADKLKKVTFQASLGSMYEKRERLETLGAYLTTLAYPDGNETLKTDVIRAAQICKADLVSQMVIEFTKLQGVIGRVYAERAGENAEVSGAVEQHYRPVHAGAELPESITGKLLALADKIDTICGCFSIDLVPTGASDPYALRRQSIGIVQIMLAAQFTFSLGELVEKGVSLYVTDEDKKNAVTEQVLAFIKGRMGNMLADQGYSRESVNSALAVSFDNVPDTLLRIKALDAMRREPDFEPLSIAFKRVVNILKKANIHGPVPVDEALFEDASEKALNTACRQVKESVKSYTANGDYEKALKEIATLRPFVDTFFDEVMVMVDDEAVKQNRMGLLSSVAALFQNIADFTLI
ncbi:glycyl-tRNA synthetase beta chain [Desulfocicer vacuolatum DSM 3385]|uniref:Glycine--tRNA ligase beta subunit n=1 Tax=Desulfocicer vacuolatum DSM 3385 TaxID=1121400 RepID=A0A1W2BG20_9BACT|nr:glycine--tRNA ligase subunit beta [Desulfocicer vacuolatum]SMC71869.1 glycyl-tRNA synthetase beta chain [Desulfocicer vacuolatum DSM 3385]